MKILAIIGSPRLGNTYKTVQQIERTMQQDGEVVEFDYLHLKDVHLEPCRGCFACVTRGEGFCPIQDDRSQIEAKMLSADAIIFSSPSYAFNVSGLLKNFIDRFAYVSHRPRFFGKYAMAVTTSGGGGLPETLKYIEMISRSWGFSCASKLGVMQHPAVRVTEKTQQKITAAARQFVRAIKTGKPASPRLTDLLQFRIMRVNAMESKQHFAADYEYYKDKQGYYIKTRISAVKHLAAGVLERLIIRMINNNA